LQTRPIQIHPTDVTRPLPADALFPDQSLVFASRDFDAVRAGVARIFKPHLLRLHGSGADLQARIGEFAPGQLVALRFACDSELPELARKVLDDKVAGSKAIKQMVKNWRADYLRA